MPTATQQSDTQYLGLLRAVGFARDDADRDAARQRSNIDDQEIQSTRNMEFEGEGQRRGVLQSRRSQGLQSSSYTRRLLAEQRRRELDALAKVAADSGVRRGEVESGLASTKTGLSMRLAESGLETSERIERNRAEREALGL
jgi:hypothetical protein